MEDRNQELPSVPIDAALIQQILASITSQLGGGRAGGSGPGGNNVSFGTSADGRPQIRMRMPVPANGGGGGGAANGDMLGFLEMIMPGVAGGTRRSSSSAAARRTSSSPQRRTSSSPGRRASSSPRAPAVNPFVPAPARFSIGSSARSSRAASGGSAAVSRSSSTARSSSAAASASASVSARSGGESRAARQAESAFASLFAQIGQAAVRQQATASGSGSRSSSSPRIRRGGTHVPQRGSASGAGNGNPPHR